MALSPRDPQGACDRARNVARDRSGDCPAFRARGARRQALVLCTVTSASTGAAPAGRTGRHQRADLARHAMRSRSAIGVDRRNGDRAIPLQELQNAVVDVRGGRSFARPARRLSRASADRSAGRIECSPRGLATCPIGNGNLVARVGITQQRVTTLDRLMLLLPVLMWVAAALITWLLVSRLLIRPLKRLRAARSRDYQPGQAAARACRASSARRREIQELRDAFARAIARVDESEREMSSRARRSAAAGPRSPSSREEQPPGRRLAAQHPRSQRGNAAKRAPLMPGSAAGSARCRSSTATISRRWRRIAGSHCVRCCPSSPPNFARGAPEAARGLTIDLELDTR